MINKQKYCLIEWVDASIWGSDPISYKNAKEYGLTHGFVCGFLVHEDEEKVVVAMDWFDENDDIRTVCTYPKSGIKKLIVRDFPIELSNENKKTNL